MHLMVCNIEFLVLCHSNANYMVLHDLLIDDMHCLDV